MKKWAILFLVLILSVWIGFEINTEPGYVLLAYRDWTVEMPLWALFALWLIGTFLLVLCWKALMLVLNFPSNTSSFWRTLRERRAKENSQQGFITLLEDNWPVAEKLLIKGVSPTDESALFNYLGAAVAASHQDKQSAVDKYLQQAHRHYPDAARLISLVSVRLQIKQGQFESALATLQHLHRVHPKHAPIAHLLIQVAITLDQWQEAHLHLKSLNKHALPSVEFESLQQSIYTGLLDHLLQTGDPAQIEAFWKELTSAWQKNPALLERYVAHLQQAGLVVDAGALLKAAIKHHWDPLLVHCYGNLQGPDAEYQIKTAEKWLKDHHDDPALLQALGTLAYHQKLWGKARQYLQAALDKNPTAEGYLLLGQAFTAIHESEKAHQAYEQGLRTLIKKETVPVV